MVAAGGDASHDGLLLTLSIHTSLLQSSASSSSLPHTAAALLQRVVGLATQMAAAPYQPLSRLGLQAPQHSFLHSGVLMQADVLCGRVEASVTAVRRAVFTFVRTKLVLVLEGDGDMEAAEAMADSAVLVLRPLLHERHMPRVIAVVRALPPDPPSSAYVSCNRWEGCVFDAVSAAGGNKLYLTLSLSSATVPMSADLRRVVAAATAALGAPVDAALSFVEQTGGGVAAALRCVQHLATALHSSSATVPIIHAPTALPLLQAPTPLHDIASALCACVHAACTRAGATLAPPLPLVLDRTTAVAASTWQQEVWDALACARRVDRAAFERRVVLRTDVPLKLQHVRAALRRLLGRHPVLRSSFAVSLRGRVRGGLGQYFCSCDDGCGCNQRAPLLSSPAPSVSSLSSSSSSLQSSASSSSPPSVEWTAGADATPRLQHHLVLATGPPDGLDELLTARPLQPKDTVFAVTALLDGAHRAEPEPDDRGVVAIAVQGHSIAVSGAAFALVLDELLVLLNDAQASLPDAPSLHEVVAAQSSDAPPSAVEPEASSDYW